MPTEPYQSTDSWFWGLIEGRRSVRRYADRPVAASVVDSLLRAAHWAPSAHNRQSWRFVVLETSALRRELAERMATRWQAELIQDSSDLSEATRRARISVLRITGAPAVILPCLDLATLDTYPDPARQLAEWQMGVQSVALACQNLLLAAHQHGLQGCWMCAPIFCTELVVETLALPETWQPQALLTLGYPRDDAPISKARNPLEQHVLRK